PVLAAAPVSVLLAATLVSVRLIPSVARIADRRATRSRGSVFPLAAWEVGRRSRQATAAVLLLTLALAVGTFGQSFLATWQQSQVDQANLAVGPPVRVPANAASVGSQGVALAVGATGKPQPVIHRIAAVVDGSGEDTDNIETVLGLTGGARKLLATGRDGELGGAQVAKLPAYDAGAGARLALPGDVRGLQAVVRIGTPGSALPGVSVNLAAVIQDGNGLLTSVQLGSVPINGEPQVVRGLLPVKARGAAPLSFVGFESFVTVGDRAAYGDGNSQAKEDILFGQLAVLHPSADAGDFATAPVTVARHLPWVAEEIFGGTERPTSGEAPPGWQLRLSVVIPPEVDQQGAAYLLAGWTPVASVPAVVTSALAKSVDVHVGDNLALDVSGTRVQLNVVDIVQLIPGAADFTALSAATASGAAAAAIGSVAVDQAELERALVQGGQPGAMVDEWWIDVPAGQGESYLGRHTTVANGGVSREVLALQMQQDPLRVATQAALWLSIVAAALLAAIGFAVHTAASMRARRLEFAQLRAIGLSRRSLAGVVGAESLLLCAIGTVFGVAIGVLLSWLVGPLVAVSPDGSPAVPTVAIVLPMGSVALLILEVVAVLALVVLAVAVAQRSISPAQILRGADE
ncbi:MAG TPA: ABC transporter permease, partial [Galbitalea sp.]